MINDTIADMLTRIRNANLAKHQIVQVYATKMTRNIVKVLKDEGFIYKFEEIGENTNKYLLICLKYKGKNKKPVITSLKRISKPGLRVYANHKELPKVLGGIGIAIISTSKGVMSDYHARHYGLGGEILCYIW
uniref:Small ribosomal subunit protein uS8c n=2 Tax=Gracilariopsis TaxID=2781 RepID=A0A1C9CFA1_9FLOR|nr:ribosomal protein S6 [Gracilariopsis lemaneiformis]YP_009294787.1 ribosomal protein S8 [Gracilariopsis chorda]AJO68428.1 ribosomal protein S8 [Gracilariopsis lemaneiformis]AML79924.1 ribosomal protein S6 [Gracilariopsis lemaneiformis]AOM67047.1 ribosomal protein S8 [Gracilariopsis chorda]UAD88894.1 ribosomal protein S8 [Gracilariopsis chorda]